jgi:hypothetical protein
MQQGLNVRCHFSPGNLYSKERYVNGFKALRPGNEQLVVFGAIVGVPPAALAQMPSDYATNDVAREAFYDGIMQHPSMQPMVDTKDTPSPDDDSLTPSCETENGRAYAPRRIVEVARSFGGNGVVQSICQSDLGPAVEAIAGRIAAQLGAACLPRPLIASGGQVAGCDVLWALPVPAQAPANAPTSCAALSFLSPVGDDATTPDGGQLCAVAQLAVVDGAASRGDGWYYDDFSEETDAACTSGQIPARIAFTPGAQPPSGVRAFLDCGR